MGDAGFFKVRKTGPTLAGLDITQRSTGYEPRARLEVSEKRTKAFEEHEVPQDL